MKKLTYHMHTANGALCEIVTTEANYESNLAIAQAEAYNGEVTVEDDGEPSPVPEEDITLEMLADHEERICMMEIMSDI